MPSLDFHCFAVLFTQPVWMFVWIPVVTLATMAFCVLRKTDKHPYSRWTQWSVFTPTIIIAEIICLSAWQQMHPYDNSVGDKTGLLFSSLLPVMAYLIWRLRRCWLFASLICLAQLWLAFVVMGVIAMTELQKNMMN